MSTSDAKADPQAELIRLLEAYGKQKHLQGQEAAAGIRSVFRNKELDYAFDAILDYVQLQPGPVKRLAMQPRH